MQVHTALDIVDQMCKEDLPLCIDMLNSILHACEENLEFSLICYIDCTFFVSVYCTVCFIFNVNICTLNQFFDIQFPFIRLLEWQ